MVRVITLDREYGCGGAAIAARLAERLGWALWDEGLTREIARRANCALAAVRAREERRDPLYYRLLKPFLRGSFEATLQRDRLGELDADRIKAITERLVREAAEGGRCVIVGRGAQYFLQGRADAYHVFVYAPHEEKMRRERAAGVSPGHARRLLATTDRGRAAFIRNYFDITWPGRHRYHLMLNSIVGDEAAAETILRAVEARDGVPAR